MIRGEVVALDLPIVASITCKTPLRALGPQACVQTSDSEAAHDLPVTDRHVVCSRGSHYVDWPERACRAGRSAQARSSNPRRHARAHAGQGHYARRPDPDPHLQKGSRARGLEEGPQWALRASQDLPDLPLVGPAWPQTQAGRPANARGLLCGHAHADEPELGLLSVLQHRLSERL